MTEVNTSLIQNSNTTVQQHGSLITKLCFSLGQENIYLVERFYPGSNLYNLGNVLSLQGNLNISHLEKSLNIIVARHEALRTWPQLSSTVWRPAIASQLNIKLQPDQIPATSNQEDAIKAWSNAIIYRSYIIGKEPLFRFGLLEISENKHYFAFAFHHSIFDNGSTKVFLQELNDNYAALETGKATHLDSVTSYYDFAYSQRQGMVDGSYNNHINFWKSFLANVPPTLELPTDKPRQKIAAKTSHYNFHLPKEIVISIKKLAKANGCTNFLLLFAVIQLLIYHYSKQTSFTIGLPVLARNNPKLHNIIGLFVNIIPVPVHINLKDSFESFLKSVRNNFIQAYKYQDLPTMKILQTINIPRHLDREPLFQIVFNFINFDVNSVTLANLQTENYHMGSGYLSGFGRTLTDLYIQIQPEDEYYRGSFVYSDNLFLESTIKQMIQRFNQLLKNVIQHSSATLDLLLSE